MTIKDDMINLMDAGAAPDEPVNGVTQGDLMRWFDEAEATQLARDERMRYAIDLQRIIEDLCKGRDIRTPQTTARHHYNMAIAKKRAERAE